MKKFALGIFALSIASHGVAGTMTVHNDASAKSTNKAYGQGQFVPGEVLVKFKKGNKANWLRQKHLGFMVAESFDLSFGEFSTLKLNNKAQLEEVIHSLNNHPDIEYAEPNYIYNSIGFKQAQIDDPRFDDLWGLVNTGHNEPVQRGGRGTQSPGVLGADINAQKAWEITKGSENIKIAVIDTGIDYNHPDLRANMWVNEAELNGIDGVDDDGNGYVDDIHGYDFANNDGDPMDGAGHGTHCAGTIAAEHDNGLGVAGVMANASLVALKFLSDNGSGTSANAIKAIDYATKMNVDIMSNSWGGGGKSQALKEAIERAARAGIVFTAAAGNSGTDNNLKPHYPSNYDVENVVSVAAHNYADEFASFSCYGSKTVHVAAPGHNILSTTPGNTYSVYSGTSMATPHVTGVIGLFLSKHGRTELTNLRDRLMSSSVYNMSYGKKLIGGGRVDAFNFLEGIQSPRPRVPQEQDWQDVEFSWESDHPYGNYLREDKLVNVPGAKYIRVVIEKYEIELRYDFLQVFDSEGDMIDAVSGAGEDYVSKYVIGDSILIRFDTDPNQSLWGFKIQKLQAVF